MELVVAGVGVEDAGATELVFVWLGGEDGRHTERVDADEDQEQAAWITRFSRPGLHTIGRAHTHTHTLTV